MQYVSSRQPFVLVDRHTGRLQDWHATSPLSSRRDQKYLGGALASLGGALKGVLVILRIFGVGLNLDLDLNLNLDLGLNLDLDLTLNRKSNSESASESKSESGSECEPESEYESESESESKPTWRHLNPTEAF